MTAPNATREAALAAVQAWLVHHGFDRVSRSLATDVLRLAERCAREGMVVGRDIGGLDVAQVFESVQRALTAEDQGTDGP